MSSRIKIEMGLLIIILTFFLIGYLRTLPKEILTWYGKTHTIKKVPRKGNLDATLLVASDIHVGSKSCNWSLKKDGKILKTCTPIRPWILKLIESMNTISDKFLPVFNQKVPIPSGVIVCGDLTQNGYDNQWIEYTRLFGLTGKDGKLKFPVFDIPGNHDLRNRAYTLTRMNQRQGGTLYFRDFNDLRIVALGEAPSQQDLKKLMKILARTGKNRPVILFMHFPLYGPYSKTWFTADTYTESLYNIIKEFNILAILHGHFHGSGYYKWKGFDVYNIGSVKHSQKDFGVIRVTDNYFFFGAWHLETQKWWWYHVKPVNGNKTITEKLTVLSETPWVPYPSEWLSVP